MSSKLQTFHSPDDGSVAQHERIEAVLTHCLANAASERMEKTKLKPHSTPLTLQWLDDNYELGDGVCIPRSTLYVHYIDFCARCSFDPVNAASFGKIIRQQFPQITTRRLGNRGQSKYHYYGIAVKESSIYFEPGFAKKSVKPGTESAQETKHNWLFSPRSKIGTRLPELPRIADLAVPQKVTREKLETFLMMYQTHCQRLLDIVIRANFDEIKSYLVHFWHGLPVHIHGLLTAPFTAHLVSYCDLLLYRTVCSVVLPSSQQTASETFLQNLRRFAANLTDWLTHALDKAPASIRAAKLRHGGRFANFLLRQVSENGLVAAARNVLQSSETISRILDDLGPLDLDSICRQTAALAQGDQNDAYDAMMRVFQDLENVLEEQLTLEEFTQWLDRVIEKEMSETQDKLACRRISAARNHLLLWSFFNSRVLQELLLLGADSYGSCQLLGIFLEQHAINFIDGETLRLDADHLLKMLTGVEVPETDGEEDTDFTFEIAKSEPLMEVPPPEYQFHQPPASNNPQFNQPPASTSLQYHQPPASNNPQFHQPPVSNNPQFHQPPASNNPQFHQPPVSNNTQFHQAPVSNNTQFHQPPASTDVHYHQHQASNSAHFQQIHAQSYGPWNPSTPHSHYYYPMSTMPWGGYADGQTL